MDVAKQRTFVAQVFLDDDGWTHMDLLHNHQLTIHHIERGAPVPDYMNERIALLRLCDINKREQGELNGRRLSDKSLLVYLTPNEFYELTSLGELQ